MSFKAYLKKCLLEYFMITTCVTAAIAILGLTLDPAARFGYESFFSPLVFGFISLLPSVVMYSRRELSFRQMLMRKVIHFMTLEAMLIGFGFWAGILYQFGDASFFALAVLIVYILVNWINWKLDQKDASALNKTLKSLQSQSE